MKTSRFIVFLLFVGTSLWGFSQTIVNGSFEEWSDSCAWDSPPIGWTSFSNNTNGPDQRGIYCDGNITPFDGDHYMGLFGCAGFGITMEGAEQQVTGLTVGDSYTVSFYAIACDYTSYTVDLKVWAYIDSVPVFESYYLIKNEPWKHYQFSFVAEDTTAELAFLTSDWGYHCAVASVGIDQVTIHEGVGISEESNLNFDIYPNPVSERLFIGNIEELNKHIQIIDVSGNVVVETFVQNEGIDVSLLESGLYFLRLKERNSSAQPFIKR